MFVELLKSAVPALAQDKKCDGLGPNQNRGPLYLVHIYLYLYLLTRKYARALPRIDFHIKLFHRKATTIKISQICFC
jgi:hypothetical protein